MQRLERVTLKGHVIIYLLFLAPSITSVMTEERERLVFNSPCRKRFFSTEIDSRVFFHRRKQLGGRYLLVRT